MPLLGHRLIPAHSQTLKTTDQRLQQLTCWLNNTLEEHISAITPAADDASFRRYFRVTLPGQSLIAMDAPPDKENSEPFVRIAEALTNLGVHAPKIVASDLALGFMLLEDLGDTDYLSQLATPQAADILYQQALSVLVKIQSGNPSQAAAYTSEKLVEEMNLFPTWFLQRHLGLELTSAQQSTWLETQQLLCDTCAEQPQVWVHRDFHSRNLMVTTENNPGVIDFQDLVLGPISYDLASIFKDCYIEWPRQQQLKWLRDYYALLLQQPSSPGFEFEQLLYWYDLTGLQRHLKVLGIFCRLNYRDGKSRYLNDLPLVAKYCLQTLQLYSQDIPTLARFASEFSPALKQVLRVL